MRPSHSTTECRRGGLYSREIVCHIHELCVLTSMFQRSRQHESALTPGSQSRKSAVLEQGPLKLCRGVVPWTIMPCLDSFHASCSPCSPWYCSENICSCHVISQRVKESFILKTLLAPAARRQRSHGQAWLSACVPRTSQLSGLMWQLVQLDNQASRISIRL